MVDCFEAIADIPLHARLPLVVSLDPEVILCVAGAVAFKEVNVSFLHIDAIHFASMVIALLQPTLSHTQHTPYLSVTQNSFVWDAVSK